MHKILKNIFNVKEVNKCKIKITYLNSSMPELYIVLKKLYLKNHKNR